MTRGSRGEGEEAGQRARGIMRPPSHPAEHSALAKAAQAVSTGAGESRFSQQEDTLWLLSPKLCCTSLGPFQQRPVHQPPV